MGGMREIGRGGLAAADGDVLRRLEMLRGVDFASIEGLLQHCPLRNFVAGDVLIESGRSSGHMYMVLEGTLRIHLESAANPAIATVKAGETVGELSLIDQRPASAFVIADGPARVIEIDEETFWRLVHASHFFAVNLIAKLAERLRANNLAVTENVKLRERFEKAALFDALTGAHNRRWLDDALPRLVQRHRRGGEGFSLAVLDIDHFKRMNDTFGHQAGDIVLASVARALAAQLRPTDLLARFGGEEFVAIFPGTTIEGAIAAAERLRRAVAAQTFENLDGKPLPSVTISIGLATLAAEGASQGDVPGLLAAADAALYRAKAGGRNRVER